MRDFITFNYKEELLKVHIIRSERRTICVEIKPDLKISVRAPKYLPDLEIRRFVQEKSDWISRKYEEMLGKKQIAEKLAQNKKSYDDITVQYYKKRARKIMIEKVSELEKQMGVKVNQVSIRQQKTRWGSCSSKGNVSFNWKLILMPPNILEYVIVHELAHLKEMNHSSNFWKEVENILPDYRESRKWLKENGDKY